MLQQLLIQYPLNKYSFRSPPLPHATISWYPSHLDGHNEFTRIHQSLLPHLSRLHQVSIELELRSCLEFPRMRFSALSRYSILTRSQHYLVSRNQHSPATALILITFALPSTCPSGKRWTPKRISRLENPSEPSTSMFFIPRGICPTGSFT